MITVFTPTYNRAYIIENYMKAFVGKRAKILNGWWLMMVVEIIQKN